MIKDRTHTTTTKLPILLWGILLCVIVSISCERRPLVYDYRPYANVMFYFDWSNMSERPEGLSIYCYSKSGNEIIKKETNDIDSVRLRLPADNYDILVFNKIHNGFGSLRFEGLNHFETVQIQTTPTKSWLSSSEWFSKNPGSITREPEEIAATTCLNFNINQSTVDSTYLRFLSTGEEWISKRNHFTPQVINQTVNVTVLIDNLIDLVDLNFARGAIKGLSSGYNFADQTSKKLNTVFPINTWGKTLFLPDSIDGEINARFQSFAIPNDSTLTRVRSFSRDTTKAINLLKEWRGELYLQFALVDGSTMDTAVNVMCDPNRLDLKEIYIILHREEGEATQPIVIPEVIRSGNGGGFDAEVEDWEEESVDIPIL